MLTAVCHRLTVLLGDQLISLNLKQIMHALHAGFDTLDS